MRHWSRRLLLSALNINTIYLNIQLINYHNHVYIQYPICCVLMTPNLNYCPQLNSSWLMITSVQPADLCLWWDCLVTVIILFPETITSLWMIKKSYAKSSHNRFSLYIFIFMHLYIFMHFFNLLCTIFMYINSKI